MKVDLRGFGPVVALTIALLALGGCTAMRPLPVNEPKADAAPDPKKGGLPPARDLEEAKRSLKVYADHYQDEADGLRKNGYVANDVTYFGGALAVLGALVKSPETAIGGALLGGGGTVAAQRYQYVVQAQNYEKASEAMYCIYGALYNKTVALPVDIVNDAINQVRRKLRKQQASVELSSPSLSQLEEALKKQLAAKSTVAKADDLTAKANVQKALADNPAISAQATSKHRDEAAKLEAEANELKAKADLELVTSQVATCVAAF